MLVNHLVPNNPIVLVITGKEERHSRPHADYRIIAGTFLDGYVACYRPFEQVEGGNYDHEYIGIPRSSVFLSVFSVF